MGCDEIDVAGGLVGEPINVTKAKTVDLDVPAESELVIEGLISTEYVEPEANLGAGRCISARSIDWWRLGTHRWAFMGFQSLAPANQTSF